MRAAFCVTADCADTTTVFLRSPSEIPAAQATANRDKQLVEFAFFACRESIEWNTFKLSIGAARMGQKRDEKLSKARNGSRETTTRNEAVLSEELLTPSARTPSRLGMSRRPLRGRPVPSRSRSHLLEAEMVEIEQQHPDGMTLTQVLSAFADRGIHLSEATFRKYVQLGLLGRSRRVGRKGKHQGSLGMYPATTVRRLNTIRQMLGAHYTIEDIQRSFLRFADEIDSLQRGLAGLLDGLSRELDGGQFAADRKRAMTKELLAIRKLGSDVVQRIEALERELVSPLERAARQRTFGTSSGSDELL